MKPILLKRHYGASLRDWLGSAEYILYEGNVFETAYTTCVEYDSTSSSW